MKKVVVTLVIIAVALIIFVLLGPFYTVQEGEQVVITRFGAIVDVHTAAGLKFKVPFVDTVVRYTKKIISWDGSPQLIPTKEKKFVYVDATARWKIVDPGKFYAAVGTITQAHSRLDDLVDGEIRTIISSNNFAEAVRNSNDILTLQAAIREAATRATEDIDALGVDPIAKGRKQLSELMLATIRKAMPQFGIELIDVVIRQIKYSDELSKSVYARMIKERNKEAERYRSEGLGEKDYWLGRMQKELESIQSTAYKQAETNKGEADAAAAKIYSEAYSGDPEFYEFWKAIESYRKILPQFRTVLTTDPEYFKYLYEQKPR